jgi:hypothetical protein
LHAPASAKDYARSYETNACHDPCGHGGGVVCRTEATQGDQREGSRAYGDEGVGLNACVLVMPLALDADD